MAKRKTKATTKRRTTYVRPAPTVDLVKELQQVSERRLELQRERDTLKRREDQIKEQLTAHIDAKGGRKRSVKLGGFVLALVPGKVYVSWKNEFIRVAGTEEAERVTANTPKKDKLEIKVA